ncbi:unnamed protein product, partial [Ectocarpus fasciculatus]
DRVTWYENTDGEGTFSAGFDISTDLDGAFSLAVADLDGDDDIDVVSASVFSGLDWYENSDGSGAFSLGVSLEPVDDPTGGNTMAIVGSAGRLLWRLGRMLSRLIFVEMVHLYCVIFPRKRDVVTADIDGDGDIDIISAYYDGNSTSSDFFDGRIIWFENDGSGSFAEGRDVGLLDSARSVVAVDLDNDGDVDLVACDNVGGKIVWYENTDGTGSFSEAIDIAVDTGVFSVSVIAVDLDGDGDFDLAAANRDNGVVVWYENLLIVSLDDDDDD